MPTKFVSAILIAALAVVWPWCLGAADLEVIEEVIADDFEEFVFEAAAAEASVRMRSIPRTRGKPAWSPEQMEGPPDCRRAGDNSLAWASATQDGQQEWVVCEYSSAVHVQAVMVYENLAPGALVKVTVFDAESKEVVAWEGKDPTPRTAAQGISVIPVRLDFPVQRIKLYLDSPAVPNWNEIDAVGLEDADGVKYWATKARASSIYGSGGGFNGNPPYAPSQATGEPDTPSAGDRGTAWAPASPDGQAEWLNLEFESPENPIEIVVYENTAPGAITKITVFDRDGQESVAWEGTDPTPRSEPWGVSVFPLQLAFPINKVKLHIDSTSVPGYNEIDAVGLRSGNRQVQWAKNATASSTFGIAAVAPEPVAMPAPVPKASLTELAEDLQRLKQQVEELQKGKEELQKLMQQLKDKVTESP